MHSLHCHDPVVRDSLSDSRRGFRHFALILGCSRRQVNEERLLEDKCLINAARSTGRCNTIQCIDSTILQPENHLIGSIGSKPSQGRVPAGLTPASDFSLCFQCKVGSSLGLRRPIETTRRKSDGMRRPVSSGMRYAPKDRRARSAREKETGYEKD